jgi:hypothetical protein
MWHSPMSAGPSGMRPISVSEGKANTALRFKRPSKALDDVIGAGGAGLRLLAVKKWYRKAADQGNAAAQRNLGIMFGEGLACRRTMRWP